MRSISAYGIVIGDMARSEKCRREGRYPNSEAGSATASGVGAYGLLPGGIASSSAALRRTSRSTPRLFSWTPPGSGYDAVYRRSRGNRQNGTERMVLCPVNYLWSLDGTLNDLAL